MVFESFNLPSLNLKLTNHEIHIWRVSLHQPASFVDQLVCTLSMEERIRARRFCFEKDRSRFVVRHGILRMILGHYSGVEASALRFSYGTNGKPRLADASGNAIPFSMSSSQGLALYGFTRNREIGVDLEYVRDFPEMDQIANLIFSKKEIQVYRTLSMPVRGEAFFNHWTRKEAFVKATGNGLSRFLDKLELSADPAGAARFLDTGVNLGGARRWSVYGMKPASGFAAAVAAEGRDWKLCCWQWTDRISPAMKYSGDVANGNGAVWTNSEGRIKRC